jgi:hypothetical protein
MLLILMFSTVQCFAAPTDPPPPTPPPPPGVPIDSGVILLIVFAIVLAFYKIQKIKKSHI